MKEAKIVEELLELIKGMGETTEEEKHEIARRNAEDLGNTLYHSYLGFRDAGFNDEQAFQLVLAVMGGKK